jgi:O-antigen ligase
MRLVAFLVAIAGGFLLNEALPPEVSYPNQIAAVFGWGLVLAIFPAGAPSRQSLRATLPLLAALGLVALGCLASMAMGGLPVSPGLATLGILALAAIVVVHGAALGAQDLAAAFRPFAIAVVATGVASSVIAVLQIFAPNSLDNTIAARLVYPGRAVGNLGQPNQLADSLVWALAALVPLAQSTQGARQRAARAWPWAAGMLLLLGVILTGSRTGMAGIALLSLWGLLDRRLPTPLRRALMLSPIAAVALWWGADLWAHSHHVAADLGARQGSDLSSSRGVIWADTLALIAQQPWFGVGWGQFSFAWSLTPTPGRLSAFVDNAHNLPLQLAVELGVPGAIAIVALLVGAGVVAIRRTRHLDGLAGTSVRGALVIIAMLAIHSLLEYPLWYTYFLLPVAWLWGLALGASATTVAAPSGPSAMVTAEARAARRAWRIAGLLFVAMAASAWLAYLNIVSLYLPARDAAPFNERIARAQAGLLFSTRADYVLATETQSPADALPEIERAARAGTNGRLLYAWARALEAKGQHDKASYLAARLREFKLSGAASFFAPCEDPAVTPPPFQCLAPSRPLTWRDFR